MSGDPCSPPTYPHDACRGSQCPSPPVTFPQQHGAARLLVPMQWGESKTHNRFLQDREPLPRGEGAAGTFHPLAAWLQARPSPSSPGHCGICIFGTLRDEAEIHGGVPPLQCFPVTPHPCRAVRYRTTRLQPRDSPLCPTPQGSPGCCLHPPAGSSCWKIIKDSRDWKRSKVAHSFQ